MAITFTLVAQGSNHLVYLATSSGGGGADDTGKITNVSLQAAAIPPAGAPWKAGLLKELVDLEYTIADPIDQAARHMLDWGLAPVASGGIVTVPGKRLRADVTQCCPEGAEVLKSWSISDSTDGGSPAHGEYVVTCTDVGTARALVRIEAIGTPQQF